MAEIPEVQRLIDVQEIIGLTSVLLGIGQQEMA